MELKQNNVDSSYIELLQYIMKNGVCKGDRTGTGTKSVFGYQMRFNLNDGFPILTTKKIHFKSVVHELLWFLKGDTNIKYLQENKIKIWDDWATQDGEIGKMYGHNWRHVGNDQIKKLINDIKNNPDSRRMLVSAWDINNLPDESLTPQENVQKGNGALACCHDSFQVYVKNNTLSLCFRMRSNDIFLGNPFNIASYALLCHMLAHVCNLEVGELIYQGGDCHIYNNHNEQVKEQIERFESGKVHMLPKLVLNEKITDIDDFTYDDIKLVGYNSEPAIKAKISV